MTGVARESSSTWAQGRNGGGFLTLPDAVPKPSDHPRLPLLPAHLPAVVAVIVHNPIKQLGLSVICVQKVPLSKLLKSLINIAVPSANQLKYWQIQLFRVRRGFVRQTNVGRSRPECPQTWTEDGKSDNMVAGPENGHIAVANVGYARVSTVDQDPALQLDALAKAGCSNET